VFVEERVSSIKRGFQRLPPDEAKTYDEGDSDIHLDKKEHNRHKHGHNYN